MLLAAFGPHTSTSGALELAERDLAQRQRLRLEIRPPLPIHCDGRRAVRGRRRWGAEAAAGSGITRTVRRGTAGGRSHDARPVQAGNAPV
jgi:hypothetical protein